MWPMVGAALLVWAVVTVVVLAAWNIAKRYYQHHAD